MVLRSFKALSLILSLPLFQHKSQGQKLSIYQSLKLTVKVHLSLESGFSQAASPSNINLEEHCTMG